MCVEDLIIHAKYIMKFMIKYREVPKRTKLIGVSRFHKGTSKLLKKSRISSTKNIKADPTKFEPIVKMSIRQNSKEVSILWMLLTYIEIFVLVQLAIFYFYY